MRHRNYGRKLSRNTEHRRALLRNLVTSLILEERLETTVAKAKEARAAAERVITLGKRGDLHARRLVASYCTTPLAVKKLFDDIAKRYADRSGGYTRIIRGAHTGIVPKRGWKIRPGWRLGDGADVAVLELVGTEVLQKLAEKREKKAEARRKAAEEATKAQEKAGPPEEGEEK